MKRLIVYGVVFSLLAGLGYFLVSSTCYSHAPPVVSPTPTLTVVEPTNTPIPGSEYGSYLGIRNHYHCVEIRGLGYGCDEMAQYVDNMVTQMRADKRLFIVNVEDKLDYVVCPQSVVSLVYYTIVGE